jgi:hypothetical protein
MRCEVTSDPNRDWPHIRIALIDLFEKRIIANKEPIEKSSLIRQFGRMTKQVNGKTYPFFFTEQRLLSFIEEYYVRPGVIRYDVLSQAYEVAEHE